MFDQFLLTKRLESNVIILMQARNLCGYGLASVTSGGGQGIYVQINQRIQACIIELNQLVEEIRASTPTPKPNQESKQESKQEPKTKQELELELELEVEPKTDHERVDIAILRFLTTDERADLGQLNSAHADLNSALSLVIKFRERLFDIGKRRQAAGDERQS